MKISKKKLYEASTQIGISTEKTEELWNRLSIVEDKKFKVEHISYYLGAFIIIGAMSWFMTDAWHRVGGLGIAGLGMVYMLIFLYLGNNLWNSKHTNLPGGLLIVVAVSLIPLVVFGLEHYLNLWPDMNRNSRSQFLMWRQTPFLILELATIVGGMVALKFYKFPLLTLPIALALWFFTMDLTTLFSSSGVLHIDERKLVTTLFGLAMILGFYCIDRKTNEDYSFWGYLFGLLAFWGGMLFWAHDSNMWLFVFFVVNLLLIILSVILQRTVFLVFGVIGTFYYLGHIANTVFADSILFPIALSAMGLLLIWVGIKYNKNKSAIEQSLRNTLPSFLQNLDPNKS